MWPQAKNTDSSHKLEMTRNAFPSDLPKGLAETLISDFPLPELQKSTFLSFEVTEVKIICYGQE